MTVRSGFVIGYINRWAKIYYNSKTLIKYVFKAGRSYTIRRKMNLFKWFKLVIKNLTSLPKNLWRDTQCFKILSGAIQEKSWDHCLTSQARDTRGQKDPRLQRWEDPKFQRQEDPTFWRWGDARPWRWENPRPSVMTKKYAELRSPGGWLCERYPGTTWHHVTEKLSNMHISSSSLPFSANSIFSRCFFGFPVVFTELREVKGFLKGKGKMFKGLKKEF